jgi:hypothetical protein
MDRPAGTFPCEIYCWTCKGPRWFKDEFGKKLLCAECGEAYRVNLGGNRIVEPNQSRIIEPERPHANRFNGAVRRHGM